VLKLKKKIRRQKVESNVALATNLLSVATWKVLEPIENSPKSVKQFSSKGDCSGPVVAAKHRLSALTELVPRFSSVLRPMPRYCFSCAWVSFVIFCLGTFWANFCKHLSFSCVHAACPACSIIPDSVLRHFIRLHAYFCDGSAVRRPTSKFLPLTLFSDFLWHFSDFLDHVPRLPLYKLKLYIQGVTGGTDQTSGGCSLC